MSTLDPNIASRLDASLNNQQQAFGLQAVVDRISSGTPYPALPGGEPESPSPFCGVPEAIAVAGVRAASIRDSVPSEMVPVCDQAIEAANAVCSAFPFWGE